MPRHCTPRTCIRCHQSFLADTREVKRGGAKYCSKVCYRNDPDHVRVPCVCAHCGKHFLTWASEIRKGKGAGKFCSRTCYRSDPNHVKVSRVCATCKQTFLEHQSNLKIDGRGQYCSSACYRSDPLHIKVTCICAACNKPFFEHQSNLRVAGHGQYCSRGCYRKATTIPLIDRFFRYVGSKTATGCILWTGCTNAGGYGTIGSDSRPARNLMAPRVAYEYFIGPIPDGLQVLHRCDNPPCINPVHLFVGTITDNMADKVAKGRQLRGEGIPWAKLTDAKVREIRQRYATGGIMQIELAAEYGVTPLVVGRVIRRETWRHIS